MAKLTAAQRKKLPDSAFALPEDRRFPLTDAEGNLDKDHIQLAWDMLKRAKSLGDDKRKAAAKAILKAAKKAGMDTSEWKKQMGVKPKAAGDMVGEADEEMDPDAVLPTADDLTVESIGQMHAAEELCCAWCLTHDMPLTTVQRAALQAAVMMRCSDLNISMYSWDYYDGGVLAEMHEHMKGGKYSEEDAAKAAPTLEAIGAMESIEVLRQAYVDVREAELTAETRDGLESAIRSRAETLGIDWWTWQYEKAKKEAEKAAGDSTVCQFVTDAAGHEVYIGPAIVLDEGDPATGRPMRRRFRVSRTNIQSWFKNHNLRAYPHDNVQEAVDFANAEIAAGRLAPGEMYHPEAYKALDGAIMFKSAFERQVFKWERFQLAEDGTVYGDAAILEHTPAGGIVAGHIRNGVPVPVSVRWLFLNGSTIKTAADGSRVEIPNKPMRIVTVDAVPNPAMDDAHDIQSLDNAQMAALLAAPTVTEGAASVSGSTNSTTSDSGARGAKEEENVTKEEMRAYLATDEGKAMLREVLGVARFDEVLREYEADKADKARKTAVKAVLDAADLSRFDADTKQTISDAVMSAGDATQAKSILDAQVTVADKMAAKLHSARLGYQTNTNGGQVRVDSVKEGKPWRAAVDKLKEAFDDAARSQGNLPDASLRKVNKKAVDALVSRYEEQNGRALFDAAQSAQDGALVFGDSTLSRADDATTTSVVLNQPIVQVAIVEQAFQDVEAMQFVTVRTDAEGGVFKVPSEYYTPAAAAATGDLIIPEGGAIAEGNVGLAWLTFSPDWRRIATRLTQDVIRELRAGPARYDTLGRSLYHIPREKGRVVDLAMYREMLVTSDEYGAVPVANETQTVQVAVDDATNVAFVYTLLRGTDDGATRAPIVRPRSVVNLDANGNKTTTIRNNFVLKVGATTLTRGYLDASGNIQGGDYAVSWETGKVYIKDGTDVNPTAATPVNPVVSYSYATNFDSFNLNNGNVAAATYFNDLLLRIDQTAALMGSAPRYRKPNVALMSLNSATYISNAALFYKLNSPNGTELLSDQTLFGQRNGVNLARINAPWDAGDARMLLTQIGATQYGVDTPFEMEGPVQSYAIENNVVKVVDEKIWYGREHSAIFTPQVTNAAGTVLNPFLRSVILYKS